MSRPTPSREEAAGMLAGLTSDHDCGEACTGTARRGNDTIRLSCPYKALDLDNPSDRRIVAGMYAADARAALAQMPRGGAL